MRRLIFVPCGTSYHSNSVCHFNMETGYNSNLIYSSYSHYLFHVEQIYFNKSRSADQGNIVPRGTI